MVTLCAVTAVPSENKRDQRTIEQVMADSRARKKLRTEMKDTVKQPPTDDDAGQ